ncbi:MAG: ComEC/Rec2 family competence protein [Patescibacteria group bacterium]
MKIHDISFYIASFFIFGVLIASLKLSFSIIITIVGLAIVIFLFIGYFSAEGGSASGGKKSQKIIWLSALSLFIIIGAWYYFWWSNSQIKNFNIIFNEKINFQGVVIDEPERGNQQKLIISLKSSGSGKILIKLQQYPVFNYGDIIDFKGIIKKPEPASYADYLAKDGIFGVVSFPKTELIAENQGSKLKSTLFKFKEKVIVVFQKTLAPEKSAFLSGITLGERAEFSKEFKEAMNKSGTTHLVALSGYNITIIANTMMGLFIWVFSRRKSFVLSILVVSGFVLMTGAEASVVRAAIMGIIILLAGQVGRIYSFRNAIAIAAFLMVLFNPKILRFDIGFQLSFLALLGIVYLSPAIRKFFKMKDEPGFLLWRENLAATIGAQLAVAPLLMSAFGYFSFISFIPNILILGFMPLTMAVGFALGFLGLISYQLSVLLALFLNFFLSYEVFIIKFFGQFSGLEIKSFSLWLTAIYYLILITFIFRYKFPKKFL